MKSKLLAVVAAISFASPALAQAVVNTAPADGFLYGTGNNYANANAVVQTSGTTELAARFHAVGAQAPASVNGVYTFATGTDIAFDFSIDGATLGSNILLTNLLTGDTAHVSPLSLGGNYLGGLADPDLLQNSEQLGFGFLNNSGLFAGCCGNLNYVAGQDNTYRLDLTAGGQTLTTYAQIGEGAPAVPEPATWAMMLVGFAGIGATMRRSRRKASAVLGQIA